MLTKKILCNLILLFLVLGSMNITGTISTSSTNESGTTLANSKSITGSGFNTRLNFAKISSLTSNQSQLPVNTGQKSWLELGPKPLYNPNPVNEQGPILAGRITAIAINQSNPAIIYAGAAQGGVWKTTDGGKTWIPLMDNQLSLSVGTITISPDGRTLFVGTGEPNHSYDSYYGFGMLKSTDEGKTWETLGSDVFGNSSISSIVINSTNPNWITASTTWAECCRDLNYSENSNGIGIYYSTNGGQTWIKSTINSRLNQPYAGIAQLVADPTNNSDLYAAGYHGDIWQSQNSGQTWTSLSINKIITNPGRTALAISKSDPYLLFVAFTDSKNSFGNIHMYNTTSGKDTILPGSPSYNPCNSQCWYHLVLAVDPSNTNILYFGGQKLYRSNDQGSTWAVILSNGTSQYPEVHVDFHAFAFYPGKPSTIFVGNDGGIYTSRDRGSTWTDLNTNLGITQFYSIAASPTNDSVIIGGTQDNGCDMYSNGTNWTEVHYGDGGSALFYNNRIMICNSQNLNIKASTDGGLTWHGAAAGINPLAQDKYLFIPPMAQDYLNHSIIYFGTNHLYKSTNFGTFWESISGLSSTRIITTIALSTSDPNVIAVGDTGGSVRLTSDGGQNWKTILDQKSLLNVSVTSIAIDPLDSSHIFVSMAENGNSTLLVTNNMGTTWQSVNHFSGINQIPHNLPIDVLKYNPITKILFIGAERGVYYYNGTGFYTLGSELPNSAVMDLTFTHSDYLVVATHGRGVWLNYMTPEISLEGATNNTVTKKGTTFTVTVTDPNGLNHLYYNWNNGANKTISATTTLTVPSNQNNLILRIYAQDSAGNYVSESFIFNNQKSSPGFELPILILTFGVVAIVLLRKRN